MTTRQPRAASCWATERPTPRLEPVIKETLLRMSMKGFLLVVTLAMIILLSCSPVFP